MLILVALLSFLALPALPRNFTFELQLVRAFPPHAKSALPFMPHDAHPVFTQRTRTPNPLLFNMIWIGSEFSICRPKGSYYTAGTSKARFCHMFLISLEKMALFSLVYTYILSRPP